MADISVYVTTFNCGRKLIDIDYFASSLFLNADLTDAPDFLVLSLQEIATIGHSFLGGSFLQSPFTRLSTAVHDAVKRQFDSNARYVAVANRNVGMTAIMLFAHQDMVEKIHRVEYAGVGVGHVGMGNKGAVGIRIGLRGNSEDTPITFVAAHLAPGEEQCQRRNQDWKDICEGLIFEKDGARQSLTKKNGESSPDTEPLLDNPEHEPHKDLHGLFSPPSHIIFAGDLNYRAADKGPSPEDYSKWPQPTSEVSSTQLYPDHFSHDQLTRERRAGRTLHLLDEAHVTFPPTYKFTDKAQEEARHAIEVVPHHLADGRQTTTVRLRPEKADHTWLWAKHRVPSWCDRILYLAASRPSVPSYKALPLQPTSDHRPVAAALTLPRTPPTDVGEVPFQPRPDWRERRAAARRRELLVGGASYLSLTWEGEMLLAGTVIGILGGYFILRALLAAT